MQPQVNRTDSFTAGVARGQQPEAAERLLDLAVDEAARLEGRCSATPA